MLSPKFNFKDELRNAYKMETSLAGRDLKEPNKISVEEIPFGSVAMI
jgi:hypothetical protein